MVHMSAAGHPHCVDFDQGIRDEQRYHLGLLDRQPKNSGEVESTPEYGGWNLPYATTQGSDGECATPSPPPFSPTA